MLAFFRDGFYQDLIILFIVTIITGTIFAQGIAWAIDTYFGDTLDGMIGEYGEYDLVLHIREEAKEAALRELERIGEQHFPGFKLNQTLTIAGQANFFFGLPAQFKTKEVLEGITSYFGAVPGLNSYTLMVEPSVLIRGVHPGVRQELRDQLELLPDVKFSVRDGANLVLLANTEESVANIATSAQALLAKYRILELRFPMGFEVDTQTVGDQALTILVENGAAPTDYENVTSAEYGQDLDAFLKTLVEMRDFLSSYASKVSVSLVPGVHLANGERISLSFDEELTEQILVEITGTFLDRAEGMIVEGQPIQFAEEISLPGYRYLGHGEAGDYVGEVTIENERYRLAYAIDESLRLLGELEELAVQAGQAVTNGEAVLTTFQEALMQLEVLQVQMRRLNEGIAQGEAQSSGEQFILSLLINGLLQTLTQAAIKTGEGSLDSLQNLDIEEMRSSLVGISEQIANVQTIDVTAIMEQVGFVRDTLPDLRDEEIGQSIRLINTYLGGQVIPGERIQLLARNGSFEEKELEHLLQKELDNPYLHTYSTSVGMVNPDARGEIFRILREVRSIVAGLLTIIFTLIVLVLDHATILSTLKYWRSSKSTDRRFFVTYSLYLFAGSTGSLILASVYHWSRAQIPLLNFPIVLLLGFVFGIGTAIFSERFSPVHGMEIMAAQSLGLSNIQIMREIVIPTSRPGLLHLLNRRKMLF